jgi:UDP-3-O-[3-hydroxymyristoyl] N-acetylglucosamine deacetylase
LNDGFPAITRPQATLASPFACYGIGLHSGRPVHAVVRPAGANTGRAFIMDGITIPASVGHILDTRLATTLGHQHARIGMVEHLLAALYMMEIDNAVIEVEGGEVPVLDGSSRLWVAAIRTAGRQLQAEPRSIFLVDRYFRLEHGESVAELSPAHRLELDVHIDFSHPAIGSQSWRGTLSGAAEELSWSRTFGFLKDAEALKAAGLARGASLENTVVFDETQAINPGGLRAADEPVRHKALDLLGDLALLGIALHGHVKVVRGGHTLHRKLAEALLSRSIVENSSCSSAMV